MNEIVHFIAVTDFFLYSGLVLQDLTFVHIGNPDYLEEGVINFSKRWQQYNIVVNMKRFRARWVAYFSFGKKREITNLFLIISAHIPSRRASG